MTILHYEFSKLLSKRQPLVFMVLLLAIGMLFLVRESGSEELDTVGISQEEYDEYRTALIDNAGQIRGISLFSDETSFSYKNAGRIISAYEECADIAVVQESAAGVQLLCDSFYTDILVVIWILALIYWIVLEDRKNGQFSLQRTTKNGRCYLGNVKLLLLVLMSLFGMALLMLERLLVSACVFGLGDVTRSIQSVFSASVNHLNVLQVLLISFAIKCLVCVSLAVVFYFTSQLILNNRTLSVVWLVICLGTLVAYVTIAENSWLSFFKEVNPWSYLNASRLFTRYKNLNIGGPVAQSQVFVVVVVLVLAVCLIPSLFIYGRKNVFIVHGRGRSSSLPVRHTGLYRHETYKLMTMGGWWLVIIMLFVGLYMTDESYRIYSSEDEYYYWDYCNRLAGPWGEEQDEYLLAEEERFADMLEAMMQGGIASISASTQYNIYQTYQRVCEQAAVIKNIPDGQLIYDKGYSYLLPQANVSGYMTMGILLLILLIFSMGTVWEMESRYDQLRLICATRAGRHRIRKIKNTAALCMGFFLYAVIMVRLYVEIGSVYGFKGITAPAACLTELSWVPAGISIFGYLLLQNLLLLVLTEVVAMLIVKGSSYLFK